MTKSDQPNSQHSTAAVSIALQQPAAATTTASIIRAPLPPQAIAAVTVREAVALWNTLTRIIGVSPLRKKFTSAEHAAYTAHQDGQPSCGFWMRHRTRSHLTPAVPVHQTVSPLPALSKTPTTHSLVVRCPRSVHLTSGPHADHQLAAH